MNEARVASLRAMVGALVDRREDVGVAREAECRGENPYDCVGLAFEHERGADGVCDLCEVAARNCRADDCYRRGAELVFFGAEVAAFTHWDAERREEIRGDLAAEDVFGVAGAADGSSAISPRGGAKRMRVFLDVVGVWSGEAPEFAEVFCGAVQRHQLIRIGKFKGLEEDAVDDGEHHGGGADTESEDEERNGGEGGFLAEGAEGVARVLREVFEPAGAASVTAFFFDLFGTAEGESGATVGFLGETPRAIRSAVWASTWNRSSLSS